MHYVIFMFAASEDEAYQLTHGFYKSHPDERHLL